MAEVEAYIVLDVQLVFNSSLDYAGYVTSMLAHSLGMERRLIELVPAAAVSLPVLRREIDVMMADGGMGVIDVPAVTGSVTLAATEIPVEWDASQVELIHDLEVLVCRLLLGDRPEVRPRPEPGVVQNPGGGDDGGGDGGDDGAGGRRGGRAGRGGGRGARDGHGPRGSRRGGRAGGSCRDRSAGGSRGAGSSRGGDRGTGGGGESGSRRRPRRAHRAPVNSETDQDIPLPLPPRRRPLMKNVSGARRRTPPVVHYNKNCFL